MSNNNLTIKLEDIFGESCGYNTLEESAEEFVPRRARELEDSERLSHVVLNTLLLDCIIPAFQEIKGLPKYHCVIVGNTAHIDFEFGERVVMLSKNKDSKHDHIYWQEGSAPTPSDNCGGDYDFTPENILNWLGWLVTGENRPDRQIICPWCDNSKLVVRYRAESGEHIGGSYSGFYAGCHNFMQNCPDTTGIFPTEEEAWKCAREFAEDHSGETNG